MDIGAKTELDGAAQRSLGAFLRYVRENGWTGRENEAVSLYAFGFLQEEFKPGTVLKSPMQIGIEVAATDALHKGPASQTRKDLVIWAEPGANRWFPPGKRAEPLVIMEWKVSRPGFRSGRSNAEDRTWLVNHCKRHPSTIGYAVWLLLNTRPVQLRVHRIDSDREKEMDVQAPGLGNGGEHGR